MALSSKNFLLQLLKNSIHTVLHTTRKRAVFYSCTKLYSSYYRSCTFYGELTTFQTVFQFARDEREIIAIGRTAFVLRFRSHRRRTNFLEQFRRSERRIRRNRRNSVHRLPESDDRFRRTGTSPMPSHAREVSRDQSDRFFGRKIFNDFCDRKCRFRCHFRFTFRSGSIYRQKLGTDCSVFDHQAEQNVCGQNDPEILRGRFWYNAEPERSNGPFQQICYQRRQYI